MAENKIQETEKKAAVATTPSATATENKTKAKKEKIEIKKIKITTTARIAKAIKAKRHPTFRGSFGTRSINKKSIAKWDKWRQPRGIDSTRRLENREDGKKPKSGFRTPLLIRGMHPLGVHENLVNNTQELKKEMKLVRIARTIGRKKRIEIVKKANEMNVKIINPGVF